MIIVDKKWIYASYLINAKKDIDSVMYWNDNFENLSNLDNKSFVDSKRQDFYVNLYNLLDKTKRKDKTDPIIKTILDLRNKKFAHDDNVFFEKEFDSRDELIICMKQQIEHVRELCATELPQVITLDYVSHDPNLFRLVHGINPNKEKELFERKHPYASKAKPSGKEYKSFNDVNQIKSIPKENLNQYGVLITDGLTNSEGLQNRQDFCIKINVLYGTDGWCTPNYEILDLLKKLEGIGFVDEYGIIHIDEMSPEDLEKVKKLFDEYDEGKK